jgi:dTDP-4-dehydrorhamnose reductase
MLRLSREREALRIITNQRGGPTPARAIAETLVTMMELCVLPDFSDWGIYHYGGAPTVTWLEFAREIFCQSGATIRLEPTTSAAYGAPAARPANSELECAKIFRVFGVVQPDWRLAIADLIASAKAEGAYK